MCEALWCNGIWCRGFIWRCGWFSHEVGRAVAHAHLQGCFSAMTGGDYATTFATSVVSSGVGSALEPLAKQSIAAYIAFDATIGGVTAEVMGGDFWEGFATSLMIVGLNHSVDILKQETSKNEVENTENQSKPEKRVAPPEKIDLNGSGDSVFEGLHRWIEYLTSTGSTLNLKKDVSGKNHSITDIFDNLPQTNKGGYGTTGDVHNIKYSLSNGGEFTISLLRYSNNTRGGSSSTFIMNIGHGTGPYAKGSFFKVNFNNGYMDNVRIPKVPCSVFRVKIYGEQNYTPIFNTIISTYK